MIPVTALASYTYCQRKLFMQKVLKISTPPSKELLIGKIRHNALDLFSKKEQQLVSSLPRGPSCETVHSLFERESLSILRKTITREKRSLTDKGISLIDAFKHARPSIIHEADMRAANVSSFICKSHLSGEQLWEQLTPKYISEISIESAELKLRGIIDRLMLSQDTAIPVELKTGKAPKKGVWDGHKLQIGAYIMLLEAARKEPVPEGRVIYLDHREERVVVMNPFLRHKIEKLRDKVSTLLESSIIPSICANKNKCKSCLLQAQCHDSALLDRILSEVNP